MSTGTVRLHRRDARVGGSCRLSFTNFPTGRGTRLNVVQGGIPAIIPVESCYLGWQESPMLPGNLIEAEIPG